MTNKKFGLFFVALVALILSACGATGYPVGNVQMLDDGKTAVIQPGSYFCLKSDLKDIGAPLKGLTIAAGTAILAPSEVVTISLEIGDINGKYSTGLCDPATGQMRIAAPKPTDVPKIGVTAVPTVAAPAAPKPTAMAQPTATAAAQNNMALGLKYVPPTAPANGSCVSVPNWAEFPNCWLQKVQAGEKTAVEAVVAIQQLAAKNGVSSFEDVTITIPDGQAMLVWCPSGTKPLTTDIAQPLRGSAHGDKWGNNVLIAAVANARSITSADTSKCWGVPVQ